MFIGSANRLTRTENMSLALAFELRGEIARPIREYGVFNE